MTVRPRQSLADETLTRPSALNSVPRAPGVLWLDKNENLDPELMALTHRLLAEVPAYALATYPEAGDLYRKLGRWAGVAPESLLLTPGSDGAIRLVFEAFVEHGESVVHTAPTFAMYPVYAQMFGARATVVEYRRGTAGPFLDVDEVDAKVREVCPKLLCVPNPDSPTGTVLRPDDLRRLLVACEESGTVFLIDEAYFPFHDWTAIEWTKRSRNLIIARTFAKAWGVAGLRIGYAVAHPDTIRLLHKLRPMYEVSTIAVEFMARLLDHASEMNAAVTRIEAGKAHFVDAMRALQFEVLPTGGNFVHVLFGEAGPRIHAALVDRVLYRATFDHPSLRGYSRFSVAPAPVMAIVSDIISSAARNNP